MQSEVKVQVNSQQVYNLLNNLFLRARAEKKLGINMINKVKDFLGLYRPCVNLAKISYFQSSLVPV